MRPDVRQHPYDARRAHVSGLGLSYASRHTDRKRRTDRDRGERNALRNDPRDRSVRERRPCYGPNPQCRRRQLPDDRRQRSDIGNERNAKLN